MQRSTIGFLFFLGGFSEEVYLHYPGRLARARAEMGSVCIKGGREVKSGVQPDGRGLR